jgi:hypothetical protein
MVELRLLNIMQTYQQSFADKVYQEENDDIDLLMDAFGLTSASKRENRQYWGRELGMCWQMLVSHVLETHGQNYRPPFRIGQDEPCDMIIGHYAIDTKYRLGSGDSGTLKKFRQNGGLLTEMGFQPLCLLAREDNLPHAIAALQSGGWMIKTGEESFDFIQEQTGYDLRAFLIEQRGKFQVNRESNTV